MSKTTYKIQRLIDAHIIQIGDGYRAKNSELADDGLPFARAGNLKGRFIFEGAERIPKKDLVKVGNKVSRPGDGVFTSKGTVGRTAQVRDDTEPFVYSPQLCFWRSLDSGVIDPEYLYYWMNGSEFHYQIDCLKGQTDMADYVSLRDQRKMEITIPELVIQKDIARRLSSIDNKIELNRQTNQTLEQIAQAIFKSWFVDFDPVKAKILAKQNGQDPELAAMCAIAGIPLDDSAAAEARLSRLPEAKRQQLAATAALFPDALQSSELGEIPVGWKVQTAKQQLDVLRGFSYKGKGLCGHGEGVPMHNLNSILEGGGYKYSGLKFYKEDYKEKFLVKPGDVLVANTEQGHRHLLIGYGSMVPVVYDESFFSHHLYRVRPRENAEVTPEFIAQLFRPGRFVRQVQGFTNGTTVNMLPTAGLEMPVFICPPRELALHFSKVCIPNIRLREVKHFENIELQRLRDALLPKLLSGEITPENGEPVQ